MAVVPVAGDHLIPVINGHLHANHDGFLPDIQMAKPANQAHAIELAGLFFKSTNEKHVPEGFDFLFLGKICNGRFCRFASGLALGRGTGTTRSRGFGSGCLGTRRRWFCGSHTYEPPFREIGCYHTYRTMIGKSKTNSAQFLSLND